ncbi:autotransporter outer membrane beta-barrel domain-containing protein, partial [Salmonella enterica subsp. enterica serovar Cerro]|nr:autotransporter outer membrane beta-barrel domain-containing protein [Salmonella enterica subsp. enterica serovar Cerro]
MIVRKRRGRRTLRCLACLMACSFFINTTYAW